MLILVNVITIAVCLGLLLFFRRADKTNRSFEKIRKFCDMQKEDLSAFVDGKVKSLENASVDVGVAIDRATAAMAALRDEMASLSKEEEGLTARREQVAAFMEKIAKAEQSVSDLMEAIGGADRNLSKIAEESDFMDSAVKKVQEAKKEFQAISSRIAELEQRFSRENAAALSAAREDVLAGIQADIEEIQERAERTAREAAEIEERTREGLQQAFDSFLDNAASRAEKLEDQVFEKLKQQSTARLDKYKEAVNERTEGILQQTKDKLAENQQLLKSFKVEWKAESDELLKKTQAEMQAFEAKVREKAEQDRAAQAEFFQKIRAEAEGMAKAAAQAMDNADKRLFDLDDKISGFERESDGQLAKLRDILDEIPVIDSRIQASLRDMESKSNAALELFAQDQNTRRDHFEAAFDARADSLMNKIQNLENAVAELKAHAYANVSEKIKIFEDDFFSDLKTRTETMSAEMNSWQETVEKKLEAISEENESLRLSAETEYTEALKARISEMESDYREQTAKAEGRLREIQKEMQERLEENSAEVQSFAEQYRAEFRQARESAESYARRELQVHSASLQEALRVQQLDIETRYKELLGALDEQRESAEATMDNIKDGIADWQRRNEKAVEAAASEIGAKIEDFRDSSAAMIANVEASAQSEFSAAVTRIGRDTEELRDQVETLREKITTAGADLDKRSEEALESFDRAFQELSQKADAQARKAREQAENAALGLKAQGAEISASLEDTRQRLFKKVQSDADSLSKNLDEISERQKAFVEQTRIFSRADELKANLENSIEKLKIEASNLNIYDEEMARLRAQYQQVREMSIDAEQKIAKIFSDKKRIDAIESNFNLLLDISAKTTEQLSEMTRTKDDVLDYQVRIKRFEESINNVNERYDRIERKSLAIDQTLNNADRAFESLKELEKNLKEFREKSASVPADLEAIQSKISGLLESSERIGELESKITQLESELSDTEKRAKRIQDDRKAFVNMEKRLVDLKAQADKAVGLFRTISKPEAPSSKKEKGAPSFEQRAYVKELKHKNWSIDEIAKNMKLSKAEVELILDEPD